jgi:hypothetical protein
MRHSLERDCPTENMEWAQANSAVPMSNSRMGSLRSETGRNRGITRDQWASRAEPTLALRAE